LAGETATGPEDTSPLKGDKADKAVIDGVDAHEESDKEMQRRTPDAEPNGQQDAGRSHKSAAKNSGLAEMPAGAPPQGGQQGAGADRDETGEA